MRHRLCQIRIYDCNVRRDFEVCQRVFDTFFIVCDNCERGYLGCCSGCRRNCTEVSFLTKFRHSEYFAHLLEGDVRILVFDPHCLCCVDWRSAAHCYDPVRLELFHRFCTAHNRLYRRVRLNSFEKLYFHASLFQVIHCTIQETEAFHGTAAYTDHCAFSLKCFQCL